MQQCRRRRLDHDQAAARAVPRLRQYLAYRLADAQGYGDKTGRIVSLRRARLAKAIAQGEVVVLLAGGAARLLRSIRRYQNVSSGVVIPFSGTPSPSGSLTVQKSAPASKKW